MTEQEEKPVGETLKECAYAILLWAVFTGALLLYRYFFT